VRAASTIASDAPADVLKSESARGPLTAWSVDQIGKLLGDIDVRAYGRKQNIYRIDDRGGWQTVSEEYFISFDDLRRERFPKLDIITPEHLFLALCEMVDQRLLTTFTGSYATIAGRPMHLNLSVASVIGAAFTRFTHSVPRDKRSLLTFELHRGDLFQDFSRTLNAIELLHEEGFRVAIDSLTPDMLPYLNLARFEVDAFKINVSGDRIGLLADNSVRRTLTQLPTEKVIFFRCDNDRGLMAGRELGIRYFQGWHIDDVARGGNHGQGR
jgi:EAL domain-containing protein (putative c-di-GMP-specific phosphodiesterase class I)